jgi:hypothetical protein
MHFIILSDGDNIKVTPQMAGKWVKAVFLVVLGIVLLIYADRFVDDLSKLVDEALDNQEIAFPAVWDLLTILLWILVAWLFVDAALTVALSFSEHRYSLMDVMKRLQKIEKKLGLSDIGPSERPEYEREQAVKAVEESPEDDVPPPPRE